MRVTEHLRETSPGIRIDTTAGADDRLLAFVEIRAWEFGPTFTLCTTDPEHFEAIAAAYTDAAQRLRHEQHQQAKAAVA